MNICGVLVHANPAKAALVAERLRAMPGVEVHDAADGGRLVVSVEDTRDSLALDAISQIHRTDGVVAAALVYHHFDSESETVTPRLAASPSAARPTA